MGAPRKPRIPEGWALGAHMSIAGGFAKAARRAEAAGCTALQVFTKSSNQWAAKPLDDADVAAYRGLLEPLGIRRVIAHSSYLINLASPDRKLYERSIGAFKAELLRAEALGIEQLVFHPGAHVGEGEAAGIARVAAALNRIHGETPDVTVKTTIETTAGQGSCLGHRFEEIRDILAALDEPERAAVCFDTCHALAAGYDIRTADGCKKTFAGFDRVVGRKWLQAFHLNDSKKGLGSKVDRHEHIGEGEVGLEAFRWILTRRRFRGLPMVLETPKGPPGVDAKDEAREDCRNLRKLVSLAET